MVKMADTLASEVSSASCAGSNPAIGTSTASNLIRQYFNMNEKRKLEIALPGKPYEDIYEAGFHGDLDSVKTLLAAGADPNARGPKNCTVLHMAAISTGRIASKADTECLYDPPFPI